MRKVTSVILIAVIAAVCCVCVAGCNDKTENTVNVAVPDGAPALAIAKMLNGMDFKGYKVNYEIVDGTDIAAKLSSKQVDLAIVPTNLGANLYNNGVKIKMVATNIYGLLYIVGTEEITSVTALRGEKILCTGQGGTPDFVLQYILSINGIDKDDVTIEYISQGSDAIAALKNGSVKFALLGEPAATMATAKAGAHVLFDLQSEWEKITGSYGYPQACTVVSDDLFAQHSGFLKEFLKAMNDNLIWIGENAESVNEAIAKYNGKTSFASVKVIERCNVKYVGALESRANVESYLEVMASFNPKFIGGKLPDLGFYAGVKLD